MRLLALLARHDTPTGPLLVVLIVLVLLYVGWRTGRLRRLRSAAGGARMRSNLKDLRVRPLTFLPLAVLLIVVAVLVLGH